MRTHAFAPQPVAKLEPGDLVDARTAGEILGGVSEKTLANWRAKCTGPRAVRVGARMIRYRRSDLEAFLLSGDGEVA